MYTLQNYLDEVAKRSDFPDVDPDTVTRALNEGKDRMQPYLRLLASETLQITGETATYVKPGDLYRLFATFRQPVTGDPVLLQMVPIGPLPKGAYRETPTGIDVRCDATGTVRFDYERTVADLVVPADTFSFPEVWQDLPLIYALRIAKEMDTEFEEARVFESQFERRLEELKTEQQRQVVRRPRRIQSGSWL